MEKTLAERLNELDIKIDLAERGRDAWKGKPSEHYDMASRLVEAYKKERTKLLNK